MHWSYIRYQAVLVGLAVMLGCLSGCKSKVSFGLNWNRVKETRIDIEKVIPEPERREAMLSISTAYAKELKAIEEEAVGIRKEIVEANRNYDTSREELERLYARLGELTEELGGVVKKHSLALRRHCSEDEWKQIASNKSALVEFEFQESP